MNVLLRSKIDGAAKDWFGSSVALSSDGGTALIGAERDDNMKGSAYVFTRSADGSWTQQAKLTAPDGASRDQFGSSVSLAADGRMALVGARNYDDKGNDSGSAYIFMRTYLD